MLVYHPRGSSQVNMKVNELSHKDNGNQLKKTSKLVWHIYQQKWGSVTHEMLIKVLVSRRFVSLKSRQ